MALCSDSASPFSTASCSEDIQSWAYDPTAGFARNAQAFLAARVNPNTFIITIAIIVLTSIATTRIRSGSRKTRRADGSIEPPSIPYWIPFLGNGIDFVWNNAEYWRKTRDSVSSRIFGLYTVGTRHSVVWDPTDITGVFHNRKNADMEDFNWFFLLDVFGSGRKWRKHWEVIYEEIQAMFNVHLMRDPHLGTFMKDVTTRLEQNMPDLVTFSPSAIDQMPWERAADVTVIDDDTAEVNLLELVRNFLGYAATPAVFGQALIENYPTDNNGRGLLEDLFALDRALNIYMMRIPRWVPWPSVIQAHLVRRRLHVALAKYHVALDRLVETGDQGDYGDLDDVSEFARRRHELYRQAELPPLIRAGSDIGFLWATNANANVLVYWMLLRIFATPKLAPLLRQELAPYVKVTYPDTMAGFSATPSVSIDLPGLYENAPLFKSSMYESMRIHNKPISVRHTLHDFTLPTKDHSSSTSYLFRKGTWIEMPHELHQSDATVYPDPELFKPDRFIVEKVDSKTAQSADSKHTASSRLRAELGSMRPFGGGVSVCKGRLFAEMEILAMAAGVLMAWEIEPLPAKDGGKGDWIIPEARRSAAVMVPIKDLRVRISRAKAENFL